MHLGRTKVDIGQGTTKMLKAVYHEFTEVRGVEEGSSSIQGSRFVTKYLVSGLNFILVQGLHFATQFLCGLSSN